MTAKQLSANAYLDIVSPLSLVLGAVCKVKWALSMSFCLEKLSFKMVTRSNLHVEVSMPSKTFLLVLAPFTRVFLTQFNPHKWSEPMTFVLVPLTFV